MARVRAFAAPVGAATTATDAIVTPAQEFIPAPAPVVEPPPVPYPPAAEKVVEATPEPAPVAEPPAPKPAPEPKKVVAKKVSGADPASELLVGDLVAAVRELSQDPSPEKVAQYLALIELRTRILRMYFGVTA